MKKFTETERMQQFRGTLISLKACGSHMPFLRTFIRTCMGFTKGVEATFKHINQYKIYKTGRKGYQACAATLDDFKAVYGLSTGDEKMFAKNLKEQSAKSVKMGGSPIRFLYISEAIRQLVRVDKMEPHLWF
jgi:hypothetical protein